jgi:hypothetical protein
MKSSHVQFYDSIQEKCPASVELEIPSIKLELRRIFQSESDADSIFNKYFDGWKENIEWNLRARLAAGGVGYEEGEDNLLYNECEKHAQRYQKTVEAGNIVVIVHPFYLPLRHMRLLKTSGDLPKLREYMRGLTSLLERNPPGDNLGFVMLETVHHYAAATSLLLERGLVDSVVFTLHDDGYPVRPADLEQLRGKSVFFCGGYFRGGCLSRLIEMVRKMPAADERLFAISDLVINTPRGPHLMPTPEDFENECFPESMRIRSEKLMEKLQS